MNRYYFYMAGLTIVNFFLLLGLIYVGGLINTHFIMASSPPIDFLSTKVQSIILILLVACTWFAVLWAQARVSNKLWVYITNKYLAIGALALGLINLTLAVL